ncbi:MAG: rRNA maturation RNase YbeY [Armatimonadetes bacterium]|nr:rRNA maturation RNase YbeY [Armatimonadota bacterium]MDW8027832.1 rRNA maturation RNase YbeY [Armatimonadota bacterium]
MKRKLKQAVEIVIKGEGVSSPVEISIVLVDDFNIMELNKRFLNHDYPTDVLSFPMSVETKLKNESEGLVGEILISAETAQRNAKRYRQTFERELMRLAIHGTLHLLGYNDSTAIQKREMRRKERKYLAWLE